MTFDPEKWCAAEKEAEWRCSHVQGFLYGPDYRDNKGRHVVRDCFLKPGHQEIWSSDDPTGERYDELHKERERQIRIREIQIISEKYKEIVDGQS